jgi:hypothetical protein
VDSSSVMARGSAARSPLRTALANFSTVELFWDVIYRLTDGIWD